MTVTMPKPYATPSPDELSGRRALVTGGSRGIGAAVARRLLDGGASVVTAARTRTADTPSASTFIAGDLRTADAASRLVDNAIEVLGGLDILVNNAGVPSAHPGGSSTLRDEEWIESLTINFLASVRVTNAALDALGASGNAAIVDMSTGPAIDPSPLVLHYASAKAALLAYNAGLAKELAPRGIRVNAVLPGGVDTPGGTRAMQTIADAISAPLQSLRDGIAPGRGCDARDIAEMVAFLVSDRARWITGERFVVDGGE